MPSPSSESTRVATVLTDPSEHGILTISLAGALRPATHLAGYTPRPGDIVTVADRNGTLVCLARIAAPLPAPYTPR